MKAAGFFFYHPSSLSSMQEQELQYTAQITSIPRNYLPEGFRITNWETLEPYFKELFERPLSTKEALEQWLRDMSEVEAVIGEDAAWRQIKMTCDTENKELENAFTFFVMEIQPKIQPYADKLNRKLVENEFTQSLQGEAYQVYLRCQEYLRYCSRPSTSMEIDV